MSQTSKPDVLTATTFPGGVYSGRIEWLRLECTESHTTRTWELPPSASDYLCINGTAYAEGTIVSGSSVGLIVTDSSSTKNETPSMKVSGVLILVMILMSYLVQ